MNQNDNYLGTISVQKLIKSFYFRNNPVDWIQHSRLKVGK